jgi:MSHA biogenesis protein MshJ
VAVFVKKAWLAYAARLDAMSLRERVIIFAALASLFVVFVYSLWIDSEFTKSGRLTQELGQRQAEMKAVRDQFGKLAGARQADPDRANRERLEVFRRQLAEAESTIAAEERKFTAPDKMRAVLEELLVRNKRVKLVALKTLPVTSIAEERANGAGNAGGRPPANAVQPAAPAGRLIYRHGVELTVSGAYLDILAYLQELERLPTQLYWGELGLEGQYPTMTVKLVVYTMSLDRAWLSV